MKQRGYAMLLLMPSLLALTVSISIVQPTIDNMRIRQLQVLADVRQQLIAYSASYLESYKPTGAGPGHLPCPDTDHSPDEYQVQAGLRGDGPNPPCGSHSIAVGKLPRHISHGKSRYAFHLEDKHALWYAVDTRFINNPVNRVVNPDTTGRIRLNGELPAAAVIFFPDEGASIWMQAQNVVSIRLRKALQGGQGLETFEKSVSQYVLITPGALLEAVTQRVALWLHGHYRAAGLLDCASNRPCVYASTLPCNIPQRDKMMLLMLSFNRVIVCDGSAVDIDRTNRYVSDARLDAVFLRRHWFYRNDWWRFVDIQLEDACEEALVDCYGAVQASNFDRRITLHVQPR